ncbi:MAG: DUF3108 domain-containing protein [Elusimicrobia bacterium]|nr:DUF3108 domain-containing protein [Elusimicrobiota bacterium]
MRRAGRAALLSAAALAAACGVRRLATDPAPSLPALDQAGPELPSTPEAPAAVSTAAASVPPPSAAPPREAPRIWGRVAITTAVLSPSQLIGPEVPFSPQFLRLPAFPERLVFDVSWGLLRVGEASLQVDRIVLFNGRPAYRIVSEARSNAFCDTFYPVRDLNESWLDARTLTSLGYAKKLREGRFFRDEWVLYDRDAGTFVARRTNRDGSFSVRAGTIPARVQDILSSVYFVRAQPLPDGGSVTVDVNTPDNWPLVVRVGERKAASVPAGRFPAVLIEPALRKEGLFVQKGRRLRLWLSDDAARRPLLMKVEVFFGHVTAALREML